MTKGFEKYFPLPWHIEEDETGQLRTLCPASGKAFMDFGIVEGPLDFDGYDVQEYLVQCANLMPECVNMLKEADMYMTSMLVGLCNDCPDKGTEMCRVCKLKTVLDDMETVLAKLEGGETA